MASVLPDDDKLLELFLQRPLESNAYWAREFDVSRERIRQKREQLGLPSTRSIQRAKTKYEEAKQHQLTDQRCIICNQRMPKNRVDRGWLTCQSACSQKWRRLPGPRRKQRRRNHFESDNHSKLRNNDSG